MGKRVALLMDGHDSDLYASFCAVKLAKRMDAELFSVLLILKSDVSDLQAVRSNGPWSNFSPSALWQLVSGLCSLEQVQVSYHMLRKVSDGELVDFLVDYKISCLIAGTLNDDDFDKKRDWLSKIVKKVSFHPEWYLSNLTVFLARPWDDDFFQKVLQQINADCSLYSIEIVSA